MEILGEQFGVSLDMIGVVNKVEEKTLCEKFCIALRKATKKWNISHLLVLQTYLVILFVAKVKQFLVLLNFLRVGLYQGILIRMYLGT